MDILDQYSYDIPEELIAQEPAFPRDSSRLLVCDTKKGSLSECVFSSLSDFVPSGALLVINETKVVPARISLRKDTGGEVDILFLINEWKGGVVNGFSNKKLSVGQKVMFDGAAFAEVCGQNENIFSFKLLSSERAFIDTLEKHGRAPIPPYIQHSSLSELDLRERYQTVFAKKAGSVAAPTASLHFTDAVFESLRAKGVEIARITLHVGLGTFAPIGEKELMSGTLHEEPFSISADAIKAIRSAKKEGRPVIALGTTALRAIESAADAILGQDASIGEGGIDTATRIFIRKPYAFKVADGLLTNFHVPRSSLMMLVDAFLDFKKAPWSILEIYAKAKHLRMRFFSFGDAMLIL